MAIRSTLMRSWCISPSCASWRRPRPHSESNCPPRAVAPRMCGEVGVHHLEALRRHGRPAPEVNQIEMHPLILQERRELVQYCARVTTRHGSRSRLE